MRILFSPRLIAAVACLFAVLVGSTASHAQTKVATTGQVVTTGTSGQQILFRDKTSISAGPDTKVTVTRANYDTNTGSSNVVIDVAKGAFRYVTGNTEGSHTVRTPLSTVGVRGTVIEGYVSTTGYEIFVLLEGAFEVCTNAGCQQVLTPGTFVVVAPNGAISAPAQVSSAMMSALLLTVPQLDLVLDHFSELVHTGRDPLIRFRDLSDAQNSTQPLPPAPPAPPGPPHPHPHPHPHGGHGGGHGHHHGGGGGD